MTKYSGIPQRVVFATPPVYQAPLPLEVHLPMIPQGPAMLAAVVRARGHHVACFDAYEMSCRERYFDRSKFAQFLEQEQPNWVGFSVYSDGYPAALSMIDLVKAIVPEAKIVVGGPHFTLFPDAVPSKVDFVVVGEGEVAMAALVDDLVPHPKDRCELSFVVSATDTGDPFDGQCNLKFEVVLEHQAQKPPHALQAIGAHIRRAKNGRTLVLVMEGRLTNDVLGRLPYPAYELFISEESVYQFDEPSLGLEGPMLNLNTSRGCSYGCSFCSVEGVWGKAYRWFPTSWILGLVASLKKKYGLRSVFFREDEFIMGPRAPSAWREGVESRDDVLALAIGLKAIGVKWAVENRADAFGSGDRAEAYFKKLATLGLSGVFVGVESASDVVRNVILNKHLSKAALREFFRWARESNVCTVANVMYGVRRTVKDKVLSDSREDWLDTDTFLAEVQPSRVDRYVYVGVPISPLYKDHLQRGDFDLIDTNGYLYPEGFEKVAQEIYGDGVEMLPIPGKPNLRVGRGLLPGIPGVSAEEAASPTRIATAVQRIRELPGVLDVMVGSLQRSPDFLCNAPSILDETRKLISLDLIPTAVVGEILKVYQPGDRATILRLTCGPTIALATLRAPSAEALLLAVHLGHGFSTREATLAVVNRTVALINEYLRARFIQMHASATDVTLTNPSTPRISLVRS
jgi:radical SAM superfamily enzyme YgiQ (UPF0313 family)